VASRRADLINFLTGSELFENCCNESVEIEVVFWICIIYDAKLLDIKDKTKKVNSLCKDFFLIKMLNALVNFNPRPASSVFY
jgi:hypothetical protein